jgi:hypothetical protein
MVALTSLTLAGCDRDPMGPDGAAPEAAAEPLNGKRGGGSGSAWVVSDLGVLPGDRAARARDVNDGGYVAGTSEGPAGSMRGFLFDGAASIPLSPEGVLSSANAVSNGSQLFVGGWLEDPAIGGRPVRWSVDTSVRPPRVTYAFLSEVCGDVRGVNDAGDMVGMDGVVYGTPVIWHAAGTKSLLGFPSGHVFDGGTARDINNAGLVVVSYYGRDYDRGFLRLTNGRLVELPPQPGDVSSYAAGIGEVRADGSVFVAGTTWRSDYVYHPVRWTVDVASGAILSTWSSADNGSSGSTSNAGELTGSLESRGRYQPVIWTGTATLQLPLPKGVSGGVTGDIAPAGRYVAGSAFQSQGTRAVLWTRTR